MLSIFANVMKTASRREDRWDAPDHWHRDVNANSTWRAERDEALRRARAEQR